MVLGGTTEGRLLASRLMLEGHRVLQSSATRFGTAYAAEGAVVRAGRLDNRQMQALIEDDSIRVVVDATHPHATAVTETARSVCARLGLEYYRYERPPAKIPSGPGIFEVESVQAAITAVKRLGKRIFLATGSSTLGLFAPALIDCELFVRVLPTEDALADARRWLPTANIIAAVGPFNREFNEACWKHFGIDVAVTKDSGGGLGVEEKIEAAIELKIKAVVIKRPAIASGAFFDFDSIIDHLNGPARRAR